MWRNFPTQDIRCLLFEFVSRLEAPDLPDRIATATAVSLRAPLISRDRKIRASEVQTIWRWTSKWPGNLRELAVEARMNSASIFDLSPSEKLQLVEDLWDDLAAASEAVPVHDWQKQELARRKANLLKNPASGLSWEDVKRKVRARYAR
jgi:putative addiction module component (TIGR02574 family)